MIQFSLQYRMLAWFDKNICSILKSKIFIWQSKNLIQRIGSIPLLYGYCRREEQVQAWVMIVYINVPQHTDDSRDYMDTYFWTDIESSFS